MVVKYLLDTNALIYLEAGKIASHLAKGFYAYSVISEIELLSWPQMQADQEGVWRRILGTLYRVEIDSQVRESAILLRRERKLKLPDALIVASAMTLDAILLTNDKQLLGFSGVRSQSLELQHD